MFRRQVRVLAHHLCGLSAPQLPQREQCCPTLNQPAGPGVPQAVPEKIGYPRTLTRAVPSLRAQPVHLLSPEAEH